MEYLINKDGEIKLYEPSGQKDELNVVKIFTRYLKKNQQYEKYAYSKTR